MQQVIEGLASAGHTYTQVDSIMLYFRLLSCAAVALLAMATVACDRDDDQPTVSTCPRAEVYEPFSEVTVPNRATIEYAEIRPDGCLEVYGRYGGGCVEDDLKIALFESPLTVAPPQFGVSMYDAADDPCYAIEAGWGSASTTVGPMKGRAYDLVFGDTAAVNVVCGASTDDATSPRPPRASANLRPEDTLRLMGPWELASIGGETVARGDAVGWPGFSFSWHDATVFGHTGCHHMFGPFAIVADPRGDRGGLDVGHLAESREACAGDPELSSAFVKALHAACRYDLLGDDRLVLSDAAGLELAQLTRAE